MFPERKMYKLRNRDKNNMLSTNVDVTIILCLAVTERKF